MTGRHWGKGRLNPLGWANRAWVKCGPAHRWTGKLRTKTCGTPVRVSK